jgi:CheY-like chemotaxis protein
MRQKILALGRDEITTGVNNAALSLGIQVVRLFELPDSMGVIKQENFDMVVVDGCMTDVENVCFRVSWLCRLRVAVITNDLPYDKNLLGHLGVEHFIPTGKHPFELATDLEMLSSLGPPEFEEARIMVIEDDRHIQEAIRLSFRIFWPESSLFFADEGQTGINILKNKAVDMVLLDLGLPDMTGYEVLSWIRGFSKTPVIILSAARDQAGVIRAIRGGATDYLVKPFKQIELMPRIRKYILQYSKTR